MIVKAWNNGSHSLNGNGYGLKLDKRDRDEYFRREWKSVWVELDDEPNPIEVNVNKPSFWNEICRELISVEIGKWLIKNKLAPWKKGSPPTLKLQLIGERRFRLSRL